MEWFGDDEMELRGVVYYVCWLWVVVGKFLCRCVFMGKWLMKLDGVYLDWGNFVKGKGKRKGEGDMWVKVIMEI